MMFVWILMIVAVTIVIQTPEVQCDEMDPLPQIYNGYKVLEILPENDEQLKYLQILANHTTGLTNVRFWNYPFVPGKNVLAEVSPNALETMLNKFESRGIPFSIAIDDLQERINSEHEENLARAQTNYEVLEHVFEFERYHTMYEINIYMEKLSKTYPDIVHLIKFGHTYENRTMKAVTIKKRDGIKRPIIVIEGGCHAREWISPAVTTFVMSKLVENHGKENDLLDKFDWIIIPVLNPDGYVFTWIKDRLWRKNRRIFDNRPGVSKTCNGVDLNRNYDIGYDSHHSPKAYFCTEIFGGIQPFSEPETLSLYNLVMPLRRRIKVFISFHSFTQMWITPYIYKEEAPEDYPLLEQILKRTVKAMKKVNGNEYDYGPGSLLMYPARGTSADWFYEKLNITYSFIVELPDKGHHGFLLPKEFILPIGQEVWVALDEIAQELA